MIMFLPNACIFHASLLRVGQRIQRCQHVLDDSLQVGLPHVNTTRINRRRAVIYCQEYRGDIS